ncbi:MAG: DUF3127 domain-containing protein [Muribaculaceae bacterium]|nr:DUF3127 domain-containing protein [Muribaculaceae bacterium]
MEIEGRIILDLPLQQGTSKAGNPWKKKEWVLETFGAYPKKIMFGAFGDRIDTLQIEAGRDYTVSVDIESREFNGRWYTDIRAYAARPYQTQTPGPEGFPPPPVGEPASPYSVGSSSPFPQQPAAPTFTQAPNDSEDLPF